MAICKRVNTDILEKILSPFNKLVTIWQSWCFKTFNFMELMSGHLNCVTNEP